MIPTISTVELGESGGTGKPLLVLGPSIGTSARSLWGVCAQRLAADFHVLAWDLPGHGESPPSSGFTMDELAAGVLAAVERVRAEPFRYAGDSIGGCVGLSLLLEHPQRVQAATLLCTGAKIGEPDGWAQRARFVREHGTAAMVEGSLDRWFAPGFTEREPSASGELATALRETEAGSYAAACEALGGFDVRARLAEIDRPVLAVAGAHDAPTPVDSLRGIAEGVRDGRLAVLENVAHLAPVEAPGKVAELLAGHRPGAYDAGMAVRRAVLGDAHVDRAGAGAGAGAGEFTADFQRFITEYAWGEVWTRPGLARRDRSLITLTALVALGHHDELAMHVGAARTNGVSEEEIRETILHSAVYCGVPAANTAFRIAARVLAELEGDNQ